MEKLLSLPSGFTLFGYEIKFYGLTMALGYIVALIICIILCKKKGYNENLPYKLLLIAFPLAVIGGRLGYVLFYGGEWTLGQILDIRSGGLMLYGGVFLALVGIWIYALIKKQNVIKYLDLIAPCLVLAQSIGRWGNFFNQEAYGTVVSNPSFQWFPFAVFIEADNLWHFATFFYESLWCLIVFVVIYLVYKKTNKLGLSTCLYLFMYGTERLLVEGLRTDSLYIGSTSIRVSQVISAIMMLIGLVGLTVITIKTIKQNKIDREKYDQSHIYENSSSQLQDKNYFAPTREYEKEKEKGISSIQADNNPIINSPYSVIKSNEQTISSNKRVEKIKQNNKKAEERKTTKNKKKKKTKNK